MPMMISEAWNSLNACLMPLAMLAAILTCACTCSSAETANCDTCSRSLRPASWCCCTCSSSYTTFNATKLSFTLGLFIRRARLTSLLAYSGYLTGISIFSSSFCRKSSCGNSLSRNTICCADRSVTKEEMMHVKRIMMTTPFSMSSPTNGCPVGEARRMPTITMAMAPAAWAEVNPNIMCPDDTGMWKSRQAT